jgi:hypothetical protein
LARRGHQDLVRAGILRQADRSIYKSIRKTGAIIFLFFITLVITLLAIRFPLAVSQEWADATLSSVLFEPD